MPEREIESKAEAEENLLKRDISLRIAEATNGAQELYGSIYTGDKQPANVWPYFMKKFFALYDATYEQLDRQDVVVQLDNLDVDEIQEAEELTEEELEQFFSQPLIFQEDGDGNIRTTDEGQPAADLLASAQRALAIYRSYKEWLRESGMLDLQRYSMKEREYGGTE